MHQTTGHPHSQAHLEPYGDPVNFKEAQDAESPTLWRCHRRAARHELFCTSRRVLLTLTHHQIAGTHLGGTGIATRVGDLDRRSRAHGPRPRRAVPHRPAAAGLDRSHPGCHPPGIGVESLAVLPGAVGRRRRYAHRPVASRRDALREMLAAWTAYQQAHAPPPPAPPAAAPGSQARGRRVPRPPPSRPWPVAPATSAASGGVWAVLRQCESGGNYADDTGNGYYGAYQFAAGDVARTGLHRPAVGRHARPCRTRLRRGSRPAAVGASGRRARGGSG